MELIIEYPWPMTFNEGLVIAVPVTITLQVDPDESVGDTDYWISSVWIEGLKMERGKLAAQQDDHRIPDSDPMSEAIRTWAYRVHKEQLDEIWQRYLNDQPRPRKRAY